MSDIAIPFIIRSKEKRLFLDFRILSHRCRFVLKQFRLFGKSYLVIFDITIFFVLIEVLFEVLGDFVFLSLLFDLAETYLFDLVISHLEK